MRNGPRGAYKDGVNMHCQEMTEALEANPPEIVWVKDRGGIMRAVSVKDPHGEQRKRGPSKKTVEREARNGEVEYSGYRPPSNTVAPEPRPVKPPRDTPLLTAARTPL